MIAEEKIVNYHVGALVISDHARQRWEERGIKNETMESALKRSYPFGAQKGTAIYLLADEVVFVVEKDRRGQQSRVVTTVLAKDHAVATMEMVSGHRSHAVVSPAVQHQISSPTSKVNEALQQVIMMMSCSDEELNAAVPHARGSWIGFLTVEMSRRNKLKRHMLNAELRDKEMTCFKNFVRENHPEEELLRLYEAINQIREAS